MSARSRNIIFFVLVIVIAFLLVLNFLVSKRGLFWLNNERSFSDLPSPQKEEVNLALPIGIEKFENYLSPAADSDHLTFFLKEEIPVLAVFEGKIVKTHNGGTFNNIQIEREDELMASYLFTGKMLVEEGVQVVSGQKIGLVDPTQKGIDCLSGGNLGVYLLNEDGSVKLVKEMVLLDE